MGLYEAFEKRFSMLAHRDNPGGEDKPRRVLAAVPEWLRKSWVWHFEQPAYREAYGIPPTARVIERVALGYPAVKQPPRASRWRRLFLSTRSSEQHGHPVREQQGHFAPASSDSS